MVIKSTQLSEEMLTASMHVGGIVATTFALADAIGFASIGDLKMAAINAARLVAGVAFWGFGVFRKRQDIGFYGLLVVAWIGLTVLTFNDGGLQSINLMWMTIFGPICIIAGRRRLGWFISVLTVILVALLWWLGTKGYITEISTASTARRAYSAIVCMLVFMGMCIVVTDYQKKVAAVLDAEFERSKLIETNKNKFLINVNHELRNPLTALASAVDLLTEQNEQVGANSDSGKGNRQALTDCIQTTTNHILAVINHVLDSERTNSQVDSAEKGFFNPLVLATEVQSVLLASALKGGASLKILSELGATDVRIGPKDRVRQVLINLVSNAIKHGGPEITILVRECEEDLCFEVSDSGLGMSENTMANLFTPFVSSLGAEGTTGLGLSICKQMVEEGMGGKIAVRNGEPKGTTFSVKLPFKKMQANGIGAQSNKASPVIYSAAAVKGTRLLLVDDNVTNSELMEMLFKRYQISVTSVFSSQSAIEAVSKDGPFDFIIIDHDLGPASVEDGINLTRQLVAIGATRIFGLTGNSSKELAEQWESIGAQKIIQKPIDIKSLLMTISAGMS